MLTSFLLYSFFFQCINNIQKKRGKNKTKEIIKTNIIFITKYLLFVEMGEYGGGGFIQLPSGLRICLRSEANSAKYVSAGITLKNLI